MDKKLLKRAALKLSPTAVLSWLSLLAAFVVGYVFFENVRPTEEFPIFSWRITIENVLMPESTIFVLWWLFVALILLSGVFVYIGYIIEFGKSKKRLARLISIHEPIAKALQTTAGKHVISPTPVDVKVKSAKDVMKALDTVQRDLNVTWWDGGTSIREAEKKSFLQQRKKNKNIEQPFDYFQINQFDKDSIIAKDSFENENILSIGVRVGRKYNATMYDLIAIVNAVENYEDELEKEKAALFNKSNKSLISKGVFAEGLARESHFVSDTSDIFGSHIRVNRALKLHQARIFKAKVNILACLNNEALIYDGLNESDEGSYAPEILFSEEFMKGEKTKFTKVIITHNSNDFGDTMPVDLNALQEFFDNEYPLPGSLEWNIYKKDSVITVDLAEKRAIPLEEEQAIKFANNIIKAVQKITPVSKNILEVNVQELDSLSKLKTFTIHFSDEFAENENEKKRLQLFINNILKILKVKIPGDWDFQYNEYDSKLIFKNFSE